jgi:LacI family gluconate utilization system Gnt-I transcriptional repressor
LLQNCAAQRPAGPYDARFELLHPDRSSIGLGTALFEELLRTRPEIDAVFFGNDDRTQGGLPAALRLGIRVLQRVAFAGFDDLTGSGWMIPPPTTVATPRLEIGEQAARTLLAPMRREPVPRSSVDTSCRLVIRGKTRGGHPCR